MNKSSSFWGLPYQSNQMDNKTIHTKRPNYYTGAIFPNIHIIPILIANPPRAPPFPPLSSGESLNLGKLEPLPQ